MKFSPLTFANLLAGVALAAADRDAHAGAVRDALDRRMGAAPVAPRGHLRRLDAAIPADLHTDFSAFEGDWHRCLQTTLMTFNGRPADKHIVEQDACDLGLLGSVSKVGNHSQTLMFDMFLLNHCWFHDLGGPGEPPCPDDLLASDSRGPGNVLVKYSFKGIGSFATAGKIDFFADHTYLRDAEGEWQPSHRRAKIEDQDQATCQEYKDGIVCDLRINEYRTATRLTEKGCKKNGVCRPEIDSRGRVWNEAMCLRKGGEWTEECARVEHIEDGFVYDDFGSYYLVKDIADCDILCPPTPAPSPANSFPTTPPTDPGVVFGCYAGGSCTGSHGCCDCTITETECDGSWISGCAPICNDNE